MPFKLIPIKLMPIIFVVFVSLLASFVGLSQRVIWSFMLGFVLSQLALPYIGVFLPMLQLYGYDMFLSCLIGIVCVFLWGGLYDNH